MAFDILLLYSSNAKRQRPISRDKYVIYVRPYFPMSWYQRRLIGIIRPCRSGAFALLLRILDSTSIIKSLGVRKFDIRPGGAGGNIVPTSQRSGPDVLYCITATACSRVPLRKANRCPHAAWSLYIAHVPSGNHSQALSNPVKDCNYTGSESLIISGHHFLSFYIGTDEEDISQTIFQCMWMWPL